MTVPIGRFDDRPPPRGNDGDDFQRFVWEALNSGHFDRLIDGRYVRPQFTRGNDGAIDHVVEGDAGRIVVECKFFGKSRAGKPRDDWKGVANKLGSNLHAIATTRLNKNSEHLWALVQERCSRRWILVLYERLLFS